MFSESKLELKNIETDVLEKDEDNLPVTVNRRKYVMITIGYLVLYGCFYLLMNNVNNNTIPLALPFLFILLIKESVRGQKPFEGLGLRKDGFQKELVIGTTLGIAISFVTYYSLIWSILSGQAIDDTSNSFVFAAGYPFPLNLLLEIMYIFFFLTLSEEVLFRGFLQGTLETKISRNGAVLVQATIFGLLHVGIVLPYLPLIHCIIYGASAAMAAVIFGAVFAWRKGNVTASWIAHGTVNSIVAAIVMISIALL